jgi:hypothetical protein
MQQEWNPEKLGMHCLSKETNIYNKVMALYPIVLMVA